MALQANVFNYMTQDMDVSILMIKKALSDLGSYITVSTRENLSCRVYGF